MKYTLSQTSIIAISVLLSSVILGASFFAVQASKQYSIEKQLKMELASKQAIEDSKRQEEQRKENQRQAELEINKRLLDLCVNLADNAYFNYAELNGTKNNDGSIRAPQYIWDKANENKKEEISNCYKRYPIN